MSATEPRLLRLARGCEAINERLGRILSWLTLSMVLVTFAVVVLRYAFDIGWIWLQETITFMHAVLFLGAAAYTLKHDGHVRVDILYRRFSERTRARIDMWGTLLLLLPVCVFIFYVSWEYVADSWSIREGSREAGGLGGVFLLKTMMLVMAALMLLQGLAMVLRSRLYLSGVIPSSDAPLGYTQAEDRHRGTEYD